MTERLNRSRPQLHRVGIAEILGLGGIYALEAQVHEVLLAVAQLLELCQFCPGGCFVRVPLDEEEILRLHAVIQPLAVGPEQVVQMIYLVAVGQAEACLLYTSRCV